MIIRNYLIGAPVLIRSNLGCDAPRIRRPRPVRQTPPDHSHAARLRPAALLLLYPLIYYGIQHFTRYRYQILWVSSLLAAYALDRAG